MKPITFPMLEQLDVVIHLRNKLQSRDRISNMKWALKELQPLLDKVDLPERIRIIISALKSFDENPITVHQGRLYALEIHKYARESNDLITVFTLRALGHTAASLHVHTHAYGMVLYSLKAYHQLGYTEEQLRDIVISYTKKLD